MKTISKKEIKISKEQKEIQNLKEIKEIYLEIKSNINNDNIGQITKQAIETENKKNLIKVSLNNNNNKNSFYLNNSSNSIMNHESGIKQLLPSEFSYEWEMLSMNTIQEHFIDFFDNPYILYNLIQEMFNIINNLLNEQIEKMIKNIMNFLEISKSEKNINYMNNYLSVIFNDYYDEIFESENFENFIFTKFSEKYLNFYIEHFIKFKINEFKDIINYSSFKLFVKKIVKLIMYVKLHSNINFKFTNYNNRQFAIQNLNINDVNIIPETLTKKNDEKVNCVILLNPPFFKNKNNFFYHHLRPIALEISNEYNLRNEMEIIYEYNQQFSMQNDKQNNNNNNKNEYTRQFIPEITIKKFHRFRDISPRNFLNVQSIYNLHINGFNQLNNYNNNENKGNKAINKNNNIYHQYKNNNKNNNFSNYYNNCLSIKNSKNISKNTSKNKFENNKRNSYCSNNTLNIIKKSHTSRKNYNQIRLKKKFIKLKSCHCNNNANNIISINDNNSLTQKNKNVDVPKLIGERLLKLSNNNKISPNKNPNKSSTNKIIKASKEYLNHFVSHNQKIISIKLSDKGNNINKSKK